MQIKILTLRYSPTLGGFDDTPLAAFLHHREVLSFREHFFCFRDTPHLTCVVQVQDDVVSPEDLQAAREIAAASADGDCVNGVRRGGRPRGQRDRPDATQGMNESQRRLFHTLREWRTGKAREQGVPPYLILTNRQLVDVILRLPENPTALGHVNGIGPAKIKRYGKEILSLLRPRGKGTDETGAGAAKPAATGKDAAPRGKTESTQAAS